ncbi:phosphoglycerate mutase [Lecanosticta acicola]|uniref:Phosphoglycerate mutase n=1 Tax=Lecanosticta acicola TaxID=111012 RepID=A0AAI8YVE7_9PEZI|nr:phosphoglycerate mutase [Lecanosticta acicola]
MTYVIPARAWHATNVAKGGEKIHDPVLTDEGIEQAKELCRNFPHHDDIDMLMASPMKRTIQTCQYGFAPAVKTGHKILLMPLAQEGSDEPMDTGSSKEEIEAIFGDLVDAQRLDLFSYWHTNQGRFAADGNSLIERARSLRNTLKQRPEKNIAIVSHGLFAHFIVGNVDEDGKQTTRMWSNTECRSFVFADAGGNDSDAPLVELQESIDRRPDLEKVTSGHVLSTDGTRRNSAGQVVSNGKVQSSNEARAP